MAASEMVAYWLWTSPKFSSYFDDFKQAKNLVVIFAGSEQVKNNRVLVNSQILAAQSQTV